MGAVAAVAAAVVVVTATVGTTVTAAGTAEATEADLPHADRRHRITEVDVQGVITDQDHVLTLHVSSHFYK